MINYKWYQIKKNIRRYIVIRDWSNVFEHELLCEVIARIDLFWLPVVEYIKEDFIEVKDELMEVETPKEFLKRIWHKWFNFLKEENALIKAREKGYKF